MNKFFCLLAFFLHMGCVSAQSGECENPKPLRFAQVPQKNIKQMIDQYRPLHQRLERVLERNVEIVQLPSYGAVVEGLLDGRIDLAELGPAAYAAAKKQGGDIIAFASFSGQQSKRFDLAQGYQSILITRADRNFDSIEKLRGATVALTDPASTSGALYPRHILPRLTGQPLERYFKRVTFAGSHDRAIEAVKQGHADAAFVTSTRVDDFIREGILKPDELKVLWQSETIPFDPFVYRSRLCPPLASKIRQAFLENQAEMKPMFEQMRRPGFISVTDDRFRGIRDLYDSVQN